jgi:membrane protein implicated in regulation of membrane protease activity
MTFLVYLVCFGVGLLFTLISALASHLFGGGHDADVHADVGAGADGHDMPGFSPLSPTIIASFVTAFGGLGMVFSKIEATRSPWISAPLSLLGGFIIAAGVLMLFRSIFRATQSSSESQVSSLTGQTASVITPIPAGAVGEIAYVQGGTRYTAPAREENGAAIANGRTVKITRVVGSQFYVVAT